MSQQNLPNKGKILALDLGTRRTGVAVSDKNQKIAFPHPEIHHKSTDELIENLASVIDKEKIEGILIGLPVDMKGEVTRQTKITMIMIDQIKEAFTLPIELIDERLTSQIARATSPKNSAIDSRAAQLMLEIKLA